MRGSSRRIVKGLSLEHFKCGFDTSKDVEVQCCDCEGILKISKAKKFFDNLYCQSCYEWRIRVYERDLTDLDEDLKRGS